MSWASLYARKIGGRGAPGSNTISVQKNDLVLRLGVALLNQLGWQHGDTLDVLAGEGPDYGRARIVRADTTWKLVTPGGNNSGASHGLVVKLSKRVGGVPTLPEMPDSYPSTAIAAAVVEGGIEFQLPWPTTIEAVARAVQRNVMNKWTPSTPRELAPKAGKGVAKPTVETVEQAIARGVKPTVLPPAMPAPSTGGVPVYPKTAIGNGKAR